MESTDTQLVEAFLTTSYLLKEKLIRALEKSQVSILQLQALVFINKHANCQMTEIANNFRIELPSATSLVNKLVDLKLVTRITDKNDRRKVLISLTSKGTKALTRGVEERKKHVGSLVSRLPKDDRKNLLEILHKLIATIKETNEK